MNRTTGAVWYHAVNSLPGRGPPLAFKGKDWERIAAIRHGQRRFHDRMYVQQQHQLNNVAPPPLPSTGAQLHQQLQQDEKESRKLATSSTLASIVRRTKSAMDLIYKKSQNDHHQLTTIVNQQEVHANERRAPTKKPMGCACFSCKKSENGNLRSLSEERPSALKEQQALVVDERLKMNGRSSIRREIHKSESLNVASKAADHGDNTTTPQIVVNERLVCRANRIRRLSLSEENITSKYDMAERPTMANKTQSAASEGQQQQLVSFHNWDMPEADQYLEERSLVSRRSDETSIRSGGPRRPIPYSASGGAVSASVLPDYKKEKMPVIVGILTVILFILGGAVLFAVWEGWNIFDGAYFSFVTLTTIGFGDMVPGKSLDSDSQEKLIICSLYLLFGMALIAMCFKLMQDDVVQKTRWLGQKIGILVKEEESSDEDESEEEYDEEMGIEEEDEDVDDEENEFNGDDKITEDKRTLSSAESSRKEEEEKQSKR
uniref:Potassium channel domain-containing protein n=1 Tax=Romanomermis culicivorax TaxID=13658 RepID=A0A915I4A8_ROMCU